MEEALYDSPMYREFAGGGMGEDHLSIDSITVQLRHLLDRHSLSLQLLVSVYDMSFSKFLLLKSSKVIDATLIAVFSSTKNSSGVRDSEMHQTKKSLQWRFGMDAPICVDADSGLVCAVEDTADRTHDVTKASTLVHGKESDVFACAGYSDAAKCEDTQDTDARWHVDTRSGKCKALERSGLMDAVLDKLEHVKASGRSRVQLAVRFIKRQSARLKERYRGLAEHTAQLRTMSAHSNLWMACLTLLRDARG